jgi:hypothetical protein
MTVTLDGKTLTVLSWAESLGIVAPQWNAWVDSAYKRKVLVVGNVLQLTLNCIEQNVSWVNSLVNYFMGKQSAGTAVELVSNEAVRNLDVFVYVMGVSFSAQNIASQNIRYFALTLQAV